MLLEFMIFTRNLFVSADTGGTDDTEILNSTCRVQPSWSVSLCKVGQKLLFQLSLLDDFSVHKGHETQVMRFWNTRCWLWWEQLRCSLTLLNIWECPSMGQKCENPGKKEQNPHHWRIGVFEFIYNLSPLSFRVPHLYLLHILTVSSQEIQINILAWTTAPFLMPGARKKSYQFLEGKVLCLNSSKICLTVLSVCWLKYRKYCNSWSKLSLYFDKPLSKAASSLFPPQHMGLSVYCVPLIFSIFLWAFVSKSLPLRFVFLQGKKTTRWIWVISFCKHVFGSRV